MEEQSAKEMAKRGVSARRLARDMEDDRALTAATAASAASTK